jgi:hypothetical protein
MQLDGGLGRKQIGPTAREGPTKSEDQSLT